MADVQPLPRRIREFYQAVEFRAVIFVFGMENARFLPPILPFLFHLFKIVVHLQSILSILLKRRQLSKNASAVDHIVDFNLLAVRP